MTTSPNGTLLLLHLSDIHFQEPYCLNSETDQDHPVRTALLNDLRDNIVERLGQVNAILVTGDIAFKGHAEEYRAAAAWLSDVALVARCPDTNIYTIPGNHDVNRVIAGARVVQASRGLITKHEPGAERDSELHSTLLDPRLGNDLLTPMTEYNMFAASFGCDLTPGMPFWVYEMPLSPGWTLKMHGMTSTLFSGPDDDARGQLYVGALQRAFAPDNGIIHLSMMHHPPDWDADHDRLDDALWNSCAVHLLGHRHRQRYRSGDNGIRLAAGAVNPSRTEGGWEPGYNLIRLRVLEKETKFYLRTESYLRNWQDDPDRFVAKRNEADEDVFVHEVRLWRSPSSAVLKKTEGSLMGVEDLEASVMANNNKKAEIQKNGATVDAAANTVVASTSRRGLVYDFWRLAPSQRRKIMQTLDLLEKADDELPETQRYRLSFERAHERNVIAQLREAIDNMSAKRGGYGHA